ncbi:MAG TPA: hypothetical protein VMT79_01785 [Candidatus Binatia bacterium]|nr:hypothetical protein [Candidatus Binatia bacterium]
MTCPGPGPRAAVFAFGRVRTLVESSDPSHLAWLDEFLTPQFERRRDLDHEVRVRLVEDGAEYRSAHALGPASGTADAFAHDTEVVSLPRWRGGPMRLLDARLELLYDVGAGAVTILSAPGNSRIRLALMRVVREIATNRAQAAGGLLLHSAAFTAEGRGVLIAGQKRAGKTTLLLHMLGAGGAHYVSNDRVLVATDGAAPPGARGVPTIVALRPGTLDFFPALAARLAATCHRYRLTLDEAAALWRQGTSRAPGGVSPAQLCWLLGARAAGECELGAILFPRITGAPGAIAARRLDEVAAAARLAGALFGLAHGRSTSDVFPARGCETAPDLGARTAHAHALAARVPCFDCALGLGAYGSASTAGALIESVLG